MQYLIASAALGFAAIASAQVTNGTSGALPANPNYAPGYTQSCQDYFDVCSRLSGRCQTGLDDCTAKCSTIYDQCRVGGTANQALCAGNYATCLGRLPAGVNTPSTSSGVASVGPGLQATPSGAVQVVQTLTVVCASATVVTTNGQYYTATGPTTLTITNCPCTVTSASSPPAGTNSAATTPAAAPSNPAAGTTTRPVVAAPTGNATASYTPVVFKGAANQAAVAGSGLAAGILGLVAFL